MKSQVKNKVTFEDPLDHLVASFTEEQEKLWSMHLRGEKVKCVECGPAVSREELRASLLPRLRKLFE